MVLNLHHHLPHLNHPLPPFHHQVNKPGLTGLDREWIGSIKTSMKLAQETFFKKIAQGIAKVLPKKQTNAFLVLVLGVKELLHGWQLYH